jgi:hypothetical protein
MDEMPSRINPDAALNEEASPQIVRLYFPFRPGVDAARSGGLVQDTLFAICQLFDLGKLA